MVIATSPGLGSPVGPSAPAVGRRPRSPRSVSYGRRLCGDSRGGRSGRGRSRSSSLPPRGRGRVPRSVQLLSPSSSQVAPNSEPVDVSAPPNKNVAPAKTSAVYAHSGGPVSAICVQFPVSNAQVSELIPPNRSVRGAASQALLGPRAHSALHPAPASSRCRPTPRCRRVCHGGRAASRRTARSARAQSRSRAHDIRAHSALHPHLCPVASIPRPGRRMRSRICVPFPPTHVRPREESKQIAWPSRALGPMSCSCVQSAPSHAQVSPFMLPSCRDPPNRMVRCRRRRKRARAPTLARARCPAAASKTVPSPPTIVRHKPRQHKVSFSREHRCIMFVRAGLRDPVRLAPELVRRAVDAYDDRHRPTPTRLE